MTTEEAITLIIEQSGGRPVAGWEIAEAAQVLADHIIDTGDGPVVAAGLAARERVVSRGKPPVTKAWRQAIGCAPAIPGSISAEAAMRRVREAVPCGVCRTCVDALKLDYEHFIVCTICGNKRCPRADDCAHECTASNAVGQVAKRSET